MTALLLSAFIYLEYFDLTNTVVSTILSITGFYLLLKANRYEYFWFGFFVATLWFWWIGLSTRYYEIFYLYPVFLLFVSFAYALIFGLIGLFTNIFLRVVLIFATSYIYPFGFNWLKLELNLLDSYINSHESSYFAFLLSLAFFIYRRCKRVNIIFALALFAFSFFPNSHEKIIPANIYIQNPDIPQEKKWKPYFKDTMIKKNIEDIEKAISGGYEIVLLHESAFPLYLNMEDELLEKLLEKSNDIAIITGALRFDGKDTYNSSYFFYKGKYQIANKVVLVPFGESNPLPEWIGEIVNEIFFNGAEDYKTDKKPTDFEINGVKFRNAICYEATTTKLFENSPKHMVALSNNAWFTPSVEPTLQHLLLRLYASRNNTIIYHSANVGISGVIYP